MKRFYVWCLVMALLALPAVGLAQTGGLPFGLQMGMSGEETAKALDAAEELKGIKPETDDYSGMQMHVYSDVKYPGCDVLFGYLSVQVDVNNSLREPKLTCLSFETGLPEDGIQAFRDVLAAVSLAFGEPEADPFGEEGVNGYVEWGTLSASWTTPDMRVYLSMSRMYEDSVNLSFTSRNNYLADDLK